MRERMNRQETINHLLVCRQKYFDENVAPLLEERQKAIKSNFNIKGIAE